MEIDSDRSPSIRQVKASLIREKCSMDDRLRSISRDVKKNRAHGGWVCIFRATGEMQLSFLLQIFPVTQFYVFCVNIMLRVLRQFSQASSRMFFFRLKIGDWHFVARRLEWSNIWSYVFMLKYPWLKYLVFLITREIVIHQDYNSYG